MIFNRHLSSFGFIAFTISIALILHASAVAIAASEPHRLTIKGQQCHHIVSNKGKLDAPDETPQAEQNKNACRQFFSNEYLRSQNNDKTKSVEKKVSDTLRGVVNNCLYKQRAYCEAESAIREPLKRYKYYYTFENFREYWQDWIPKYYIPGEKTNVPYFELICYEEPQILADSDDVTALRSSFSTTCVPSHLHRLREKVEFNKCRTITTKGTAKSELCTPRNIPEETYSEGPGKNNPRFNGNEQLYTEAWEAVKDIIDGSSCWFRENVVPQMIAETCKKQGKSGGIFRFGAVINESKFSCATEPDTFDKFEYIAWGKGCHLERKSNWKAIWVGDIRISRA